MSSKLFLPLCSGIDPDEARNEEEETMLADARNWLSKKHVDNEPLDWQGN